MLPFLIEGKEELEKFQKLAKKFSANLSSEQVGALEDYKNSWTELNLAFGVLKTTIGAELAPVLAPVLDQFKDWAMEFAQSESHTHRLRQAVTEIRDALENFPWKDTVTHLEDYAKGINTAVENTVGWKLSIEAVSGLIVGSFALSLLAPLATIVKITAEVGKLAGLWGDVEKAAIAAGVAEASAAAKAATAGAGAAGAAGGAVGVGAAARALGAPFMPLIRMGMIYIGAEEALRQAREANAPAWAGPDSPYNQTLRRRLVALGAPNDPTNTREEGFSLPRLPIPNLLINPLRECSRRV